MGERKGKMLRLKNFLRNENTIQSKIYYSTFGFIFDYDNKSKKLQSRAFKF